MIGFGSILSGLNLAYKAYANFNRVQSAINTVNEVSKIGNISGNINPQSLLKMSETKGIVPDQALNLAGTVGGRVTEVATNISKGLDTAPIKSGIDDIKSNVGGLVKDNQGDIEKGLEGLKETLDNSGITSKVDELQNKIANLKEQYAPVIEANIDKFKETKTLKELAEIKSNVNNKVEDIKKQISSKVPNPDSVISNVDDIYKMSKQGKDLKRINNPEAMMKELEKQTKYINYDSINIDTSTLGMPNINGVDISTLEIPKIDTSVIETPKISNLDIQFPEVPKIDTNAMKPTINMEGILNGFYNFKLPKK